MEEKKQKQTYTAGLVLGILSIPCGLLLAISGWVLGIVGIVLNTKNRKEFRVTAGLTLSIIGLAVSVLNSIIGVLINLNVI